MTDSSKTPIPMVIRRLGTTDDQGKQKMIPRLLRGAVTVRYCGPLEYALRILGEIALLAATLAALEWLLPVYRLLALAAWAACAALTALDVTLLRIRRTVSDGRAENDSHRVCHWPFGARRNASRRISPGRSALYAGIAGGTAITAAALVFFLVIVPFLNWLGALPGAAVNWYGGLLDQRQPRVPPPVAVQCGIPAAGRYAIGSVAGPGLRNQEGGSG
jgi:hypothetical protein